MILCLVDDFLGVVQQEGAKQDKATVDSNAVHPSPQSSGGRKEVGGNASTENHTQSHGKGGWDVQHCCLRW